MNIESFSIDQLNASGGAMNIGNSNPVTVNAELDVNSVVSATSVAPKCTTGTTCTSAEAGKACFSSKRNQIVVCNGLQGFVPLTSQTLVSAVAVMPRESWHLDKEMPISLLAGLVLQAMCFIWWASAYTTSNDAMNARQNDDIRYLKAAASSLADMKADVAVIKSSMVGIKGKLEKIH